MIMLLFLPNHPYREHSYKKQKQLFALAHLSRPRGAAVRRFWPDASFLANQRSGISRIPSNRSDRYASALRWLRSKTAERRSRSLFHHHALESSRSAVPHRGSSRLFCFNITHLHRAVVRQINILHIYYKYNRFSTACGSAHR